MHVVNRFHAVRSIGAGGIGPRMILARKRAQWPATLVPDGPEWVRGPGGVLIPAISGGAGGAYMQGYEYPALAMPSIQGLNMTQVTLALDSNYVNAASGDAIAVRFSLPRDETLNTVYYFVSSYTGTAANVNDLDFELRDNSYTTGPSSTLHEGKTVDPASGTSWLSSTGWTFAMSADTPYWLVIGDADGSGTDYATLLRNVAIATPRDWTKWHAVQTTDGWASVRTTTGRISSIVAVFASGRVIGNPMTVSVTSANNQNRRGWRFVAPTTAKIFGLIGALNTSGATITGVELWAGDTGPSGSPQATGSVEALSGNLNSFIHGYLFGTAPTMTQGTPYRLVYTYGANANVPEKFSIGTGATAELRSARIGGGAWYFAGASGTTDWSNDDTNSLPNTDICVDDFLPSAQPTYVLGTI